MDKVAILKDAESNYDLQQDPQEIEKLIGKGHEVLKYVNSDTRLKLYFKYVELYEQNKDDNAMASLVEHYKKSILASLV